MIRALLLSLCVALSLSGCASEGGLDISYKQLLKRNREGFPHVAMGMSRNEVMSIMQPYTSHVHSTPLANPFRSDWVHLNNEDYEIMYFLVRAHPPFTPILAGQGVPIIVKNGVVVGLGQGAVAAIR